MATIRETRWEGYDPASGQTASVWFEYSNTTFQLLALGGDNPTSRTVHVEYVRNDGGSPPNFTGDFAPGTLGVSQNARPFGLFGVLVTNPKSGQVGIRFPLAVETYGLV